MMVVGTGGREHALTWRLSQSELCDTVYAAPGNPGMLDEANVVGASVSPDDHDAVVAFAKDKGVQLVVVGPEIPLVGGLADKLEAAGVPTWGPSAAAARLEGSKSYLKGILKKYNIPTAAYETFTDPAAAKAFIKELGAPIVVKSDGLAAGKGVIIAQTVEEGYAAVDDMMVNKIFGSAGAEVVVEEFLEGEEASFFGLVDGEAVVPLIAAQDHKAVGDGDTGPNTGGMGTYSPAPVMTDEVVAQTMQEIMHRTAHAMAAEGCPFKGTLFAGLMIKDGKAKLLEHNVRFGDPECQSLMSRLDSDLGDALLKASTGRLSDVSLQWKNDAAVTVVMAAKGYPGSYKKGTPIHGLDKVGNLAKVFHAGTSMDNGQLVAAGGRVLGVTALGADVAEAQKKVYEAVKKIEWDDGFYRNDIAYRAINRQG